MTALSRSDVAEAASETTAEPQSLTQRALSGVAWNWSGSLVLVVAQVASTAATARLVSPREFGFYATAQAAAAFTGYFTLVALGPGIQRRSSLGPDTVGTALTLSLLGSFFVPGLLFLGASAWADLWGIPAAAGTVRVMALALLLTSAATVPIAVLRRDLHFGRAALIETGSVVVGLVFGVALAVAMHSALALAIGYAIGSATLLLGAWWASRHQLTFGFDREEARELFTFAGQVGGLGFYTYLTLGLPTWFTGRAFGATALGVFSRANMIVSLPAYYAASSIFKVIFPLYGKVRHDMARTRVLLDEGLTLTTGLVWPLFALVAGASPVVIEVLLGSRWNEAADLVPLFVLGACAYVAAWLLSNAAEAFGWMAMIAFRQSACLAGVIASLVVTELADLPLTWMLAGVAAAQWLGYVLTLVPLARRQVLSASTAVKRQLIHIGVAAAAYIAAALCAELLEDAPLWGQAVAQLTVGVTVVIVILLGRSWMPATEVLARRVGLAPGESLVRAGWTFLR